MFKHFYLFYLCYQSTVAINFITFNCCAFRSRIFFGSEYMPRDRCREEFYPIASTPMPQQELDPSHGNNATVAAAASNVSSVLYTVQRVVTTSQIQSGGSSFAPSSSVTSVIRNDVECNSGLQNSPGKGFTTYIISPTAMHRYYSCTM